MIGKVRDYISKNLSFVCFMTAILFFVFLYGVLVGRNKIFPYDFFATGWYGFLDWRENYKHNLKLIPEKHIGTPRKHYQPSFFKKAGAWPGVTLVSTFIHDDHGTDPGILLLDMDGNVIHEWVVSVEKIFPRENIRDWDTLITGAALLKNGDIIFNFDGIGIVKLDWCANVIWKKEIFTHHNIFIDDNDNIWTSARDHSENKNLTIPNLGNLQITEPDVIIKLSPDGVLLKQIDILDVIMNSDLKGVLFANGHQDLYQEHFVDSTEFTHLNDVEVLGKEFADEYPSLEEGDIMVSLRNVDLILILDGKTNLAKWWMVGPFIRQHDPDFDGEGLISIFDNMGGMRNGGIGFASRIISIDTQSRDYDILHRLKNIYQPDPPEDFFTLERGSHQILPNGNILITETFEGRIFEVDPAGVIVWQYITKWDDERVIQPYQAIRYEDLYGNHNNLQCE